MKDRIEYNKDECPIESIMELIGGKWTFLILRDLFYGPMRYSELQKSCHGISPRTLSLRLKELESNGLIYRRVLSTIPPHVEYALTKKGETLKPVFDAMRDWGEQWNILNKQ
ncbi:helix-turn-helix domain-containing protein [Heyndrickxia coagulans]|jgi:DNA-binding HxlR family transcriptional regulator|uniref:winged helix-turn-helix transcriptional regulator n=1 Tax=Bacillaceae TaxID=186817 RepID=UPI002E2311E1|nr:helix-turn-helix domain-containing protein [Bacillus smithii]